ncbi:MAG: Hsp20/alpha crystallin family protein [Acidimicrobiia bacterium]|nr:Hsp20/alpha crystallin family protein [Acidimicrobiia bacterium]MDH4364350.1 Hsp20/alpha crystallin family protein [Acidimicrobiia bacterium]MDH5288416.1 Hsp20/alpha crystallin family protein [Acidimicrobiia bacterium]
MAAKEKKANENTEDAAAGAEEPTGQVQVVDQPEVIEPSGWMSDWFDDWSRPLRWRLPGPLGRMTAGVEPIRVEQYRDGNDVVIRAELPGVDPEAIDVTVADDELTVSARRERRKESKGDDGYRSEFHYGAFRRVMTLPAGTSAEDIKASYDEGILEVRVPAKQAEGPRTKVPVKRKA